MCGEASVCVCVCSVWYMSECECASMYVYSLDEVCVGFVYVRNMRVLRRALCGCSSTLYGLSQGRITNWRTGWPGQSFVGRARRFEGCEDDRQLALTTRPG